MAWPLVGSGNGSLLFWPHNIMDAEMTRRASLGLCALPILVATAPVLAQEFDSDAPRDARTLLPAEMYESSVHRVENPVPIFAHTYLFKIQTEWGPVTAYSWDMLTIRLREINATRALDEVSRSKVFVESVGKSAAAPVKTAGKLLTNPLGTMRDMPRGMTSFLGRIGQSAGSSHERDDSLVGTVSGSARAKRELAFEFGVSPYSSNRVLQEQLDSVGRAAALGGLTLSAATFAMPGAIGLTFSAGRMSQDMLAQIRDKTPAELRAGNRQTLLGLGVAESDADAFLANPAYAPDRQTFFVQALGTLRGVSQPEALVRLATVAEDEDDAFLYQRIAQMTAGYSQAVERIVQLGVVRGLPVAATASNRLMVFFPADEAIWTEMMVERSAAINAIVDPLEPAGKELWISGTASELFKRKLGELGWRVQEGARGRLYDVL